MTIPYNSTKYAMKKYITDSLIWEYSEDKCAWYSDSDKNKNTLINDKDITLLVSSLMYIIENDFRKIKKLIKYLKNVADLLNSLGLPITWSLPTGLTIRQSYLLTKSTSLM
jgi:hypothetical protein